MKNIKKFADYHLVKESNTERPYTLSINNGVLTVKVGEKSASIKVIPNQHIRSAMVQNKKKVIPVASYQVEGGKLRRALDDKEISIDILDNKGGTLKDGSSFSGDIYLVITTPKGYNGEITSMSGGIGIANTATRVYGKDETTWGIYKMPDLEGLDNGEEINPYKRVSFGEKKEPIVIEFEIEDAFEYDSFKLKEEAKAKIKAELEKAPKETVFKIKTGATQDGSPSEEGVKEIKGEKVSRQEWDYYLTKNRYKAVGKHLKELGFKNLKVIAMPKSSDQTERIYGKFDSKKLENPENRKVVITSKSM